jgi:hypothetical protein
MFQSDELSRESVRTVDSERKSRSSSRDRRVSELQNHRGMLLAVAEHTDTTRTPIRIGE